MALTQISTAGVKDDAVTSGKIPANAVGSSELADNAVDTAAIADQAVTAGKLANDIAINTTGNISAAAGTFTGDLTIPDKIVHTGDTDTAIRFGVNTVTVETAGNERLRVDSDGRLIVGSTSSVVPFQVFANASSYGGMNTTGVFSDATSYAANVGGGTTFSGKYNSGGSQVGFASLRGIKENATDGNYAGALTLNSRPNGGNMTERCRVDSAGVLRIGNTTYQGTSSNTKRIALGAKASIWGWASGQINGALTLADNYYWTGANNVAIESDHAAYLSLRSGSMRFGTTSSSQTGGNNISGGIHERVRFQQGGGISFNGDSAAANALDDYEEGTWTPTVTQGTISYGHNNYTKIGRMVYVTAYVNNWSNRTSSDAIEIQNLPFTPASDSNTGACTFYRIAHSDEGQIAARTTGGKIAFLSSSQGGSESWFHLAYNDLNNTNSQIKFSIWYAV